MLRRVLLVSLVALAIVAVVADVDADAEQSDVITTHPWGEPTGDFDAYVQLHGREYESDEEQESRKAIYLANVKKVAALNAQHYDPSDPDSPRFSADGPWGDRTAHEAKLLMPTPPKDTTTPQRRRRVNHHGHHAHHGHNGSHTFVEYDDGDVVFTEHEASASLASSDWRHISTPIKCQCCPHSCGVCWAFAATEVLESAWAKAGHGLHELSTQQAVDCGDNGKPLGCTHGGWSEWPLTWWQKHGSVPASQLGYKDGPSSRCTKPSGSGPKVKSWHLIGNSEPDLVAALHSYGPITVLVNGNALLNYHGGIIGHAQCPSAETHQAVLVGYNAQQKVFLLRNSWGANWGEHGYARLKYGQNTCGITQKAIYVLV